MSLPQDQKQALAELVASQEKQLHYSALLHPTNLTEQKEKFLKGEIEDPQFKYSTAQIDDFLPPEFNTNSSLDLLYEARLAQVAQTTDLLKARGDDIAFTVLSQAVFPVEPLKLPAADSANPGDPTIDATGVVARFSSALADLGLSNWKIEVSANMTSRLMVNQWYRLIVIREDILLTPIQLEGLTRHEIGVHVFRYANGLKQTEPLLHVGTAAGRLFEEGIASYLENPEGNLRIFMRHLAVQYALEHGFRKTWEMLKEQGCDEEEAWMHALRVKRGLSDTGQPGAFTRDAWYAQSFVNAKEHIVQGTSIPDLLSAIIAPEEVEILKNEANLKSIDIPSWVLSH